MPASADYLTKYLTASNSNKSGASADYDDVSARPKKRRKKDKYYAASTSLLVADDDDELLLSSNKNQRQDEDEDGPMILDTKIRSAEFRRKKTSNWQTLDHGDLAIDDNNAIQDEADRILAEAAAESDMRRQDQEMEDAPAIAETQQNNGSDPRMESGARAGLQTAADTAALIAAAEEAEQKEAAVEMRSKKSKRDRNQSPPPEEETIYRDATGRRIDISMRRAEARAAEIEKQRQEKKERENAMGEVQRRQKEERKKDLDEAKFLTLGRSADDEEMNESLKEVVRWDDPMAEYMAQKRAEEDALRVKDRTRGKNQITTKVRRKEYQGAAPPNRFSIKPGWRWDGVDRGNGFEKEWFQARGRKTRNENLEYQWAMDE